MKKRNKIAGQAHCVYVPHSLNNKLLDYSDVTDLPVSTIVQTALLAYFKRRAIIEMLVKNVAN